MIPKKKVGHDQKGTTLEPLGIYIYTCTYMRIYMYIRLYVYVYMFVCVCIHAYIYIYIDIHKYVVECCIHIVCICDYMCIRPYIYIYTLQVHTYIPGTQRYHEGRKYANSTNLWAPSKQMGPTRACLEPQGTSCLWDHHSCSFRLYNAMHKIWGPYKT